MTIEITDLKDWIDAIGKLHLSDEERATLEAYASNLAERGLPIIWNFEHLSTVLNIDARSLGSMVNSTRNFYRTFTIPKRRGGFREEL